MEIQRQWHLVAPATLMFLLATACGHEPTSPGEMPGGPRPVRLDLGGVRDLAPGESLRFTATTHFSDGSSRDVTKEVIWTSSNTSVLSIQSDGLATARETGETVVRATATSLVATKDVVIVPAGTFRLTGKVTEADALTVPVRDALVSVTSTSAPPLSTTTDETGAFRLYGVSPDATVRVTKNGYEPHIREVSIVGHQTLNVELKLAAPRLNVSGTYSLTITAAAECRASLPEEATKRKYTAVVTQNGPLLHVNLKDATFWQEPDHQIPQHQFEGNVDTTHPTFVFSDTSESDEPPSVVEQMSPKLFFVPIGKVSTTVSPSGISGTLDGVIKVLELVNQVLPTVATCRSTSHEFVLVR